MTSKSSHSKPVPTRRDFLKTSIAAGGVATFGGLSLARGANVSGSDVLRSGLIGCGGRGTGAALNAMNADPGVRLTAMTDIFPNRVHGRRKILAKRKPNQMAVDDDHCFSGLDGYRHVIDGSDVVLIACSAKYHPVYLQAAIEAGKHVFVEKPLALNVDELDRVTAAAGQAPDRQVVVVIGDGSFLMAASDFVTAVQEQCNILVVVYNDSRYGMINFMQHIEHGRSFGDRIAETNYAALAESFGAVGLRVEHPDDLPQMMEQARKASAHNVVLLDVVCDYRYGWPDVPAIIRSGE